MTWTKLSDDFGDDCARADLSDAAFRTHVEGLLWTMRRETGGYLDRRAVRRFAESPDADHAVDELLAAGFWARDEEGLRVVHHLEHQPEPDVIAKRRADTAERVRRSRRKKAGLTEGGADFAPPSGNSVTQRDTRTATERVTRDGAERDRTGTTAATTNNPGHTQPTRMSPTSLTGRRPDESDDWL